MDKIYASIITIGDELLIGQVTDTNGAWIARELNKAGIWVKRKLAVGDDKDDIITALDEETAHSDILLITGGLGSTADDITKATLCEYFGGKMIVHQETLEHIKYLFTEIFKRPLIERNLKQAEVPDVCTVLPNKRGIAPAMLFKKGKKIYISMPGVPNEMKSIMSDHVLPMLPDHFDLSLVLHRTLLTADAGESFLAERLMDFESNLPSYIRLAYLPDYRMVRLRLSATGKDKEKLEAELNGCFGELKTLVKDVMVTDVDEPIEMTIGRLLKQRNKTMATAESCTGGYIAHLITTVPGSSHYYKGSIISYANAVKTNMLHVKEETLETTGAVSEETVKQMVAGAITQLDVDFALATSGIMGPDGGTQEKPVGTVWIAAGNKNKVETKKMEFRFDRERNIIMTSAFALNFFRKFILNNS